jgi:hypothetical protein
MRDALFSAQSPSERGDGDCALSRVHLSLRLRHSANNATRLRRIRRRPRPTGPGNTLGPAMSDRLVAATESGPTEDPLPCDRRLDLIFLNGFMSWLT